MKTSRTNSRLSMLWWTLSLLLAGVDGSSSSSSSFRRRVDQQATPMLGGYRPVDDLDDERVLEVAAFAMKEAVQVAAYDFIVGAVGNIGTTEETWSELSFVIVNAKEQVVAGMNYLLTVMVMREDSSECVGVDCCMGAFNVVVYDRFGDMQVTEWLDEVACADAFYPPDQQPIQQLSEESVLDPVETANEAQVQEDATGESDRASAVGMEAAAEAAQTLEEHH